MLDFAVCVLGVSTFRLLTPSESSTPGERLFRTFSRNWGVLFSLFSSLGSETQAEACFSRVVAPSSGSDLKS
jgi:hypothetical protein